MLCDRIRYTRFQSDEITEGLYFQTNLFVCMCVSVCVGICVCVWMCVCVLMHECVCVLVLVCKLQINR